MEFITAVRIAAALIFFTAAVAKMRNWRTFEGVVANYRLLPNALSRGVAWVLPPAEFLLAIALLFGAPGSELAASALLSVFGIAMAINLLRGRTHIDCGCFDATLKQPLRWSLVLRNAVLVLLLIAAARSRETAGAFDFATLLLGVLGGAAFFIVVQCANVLTALPAKRRTT
jgi:Methylamine utilisation protein MauE